ncbi:MAG: hypothetical protein HY900_15030 [Deltaproteobacteria bacterium]|nr:hypothetical protein [Deltaproteobacteria bacterium]
MWEVIASYLALGRDEERLREAYHWLSGRQLLAALGYYRAYPKEIDELIRSNRREGATERRDDLAFARRLSR